MSGQNMPEVYSYHTFIFPFLWNDCGNVKRSEFEKCLDKRWQLEVFGERPAVGALDSVLLYNQYQYFNTAARAIIYTMDDKDDQAVRNYRFTDSGLGGDDSKVFYRIEKSMMIDGDLINLQYRLRVNAIHLKLYDTGIGLLVYELENTSPESRSIEHVNRINEFGRRVFKPYVYIDGSGLTGCDLCADLLALDGLEDASGKPVLSRLTGTAPAPVPNAELARVMSFLFENGDRHITTNREHGKNEFYIEPIIDDRMFTACFVVDPGFACRFAEWKDTDYRYLNDAIEKKPKDKDNLSRALYELVFIDGDGVSCHSRHMMRELLEKHIYNRWTEYYYDDKVSSTITGITEYSMVTVSESAFTLNSFLTQYIEMIILALVQRASLLSFERRISEVSFSRKREISLQEDYIRFSSRYLLPEVTPQQQGIEMYDKMQEILYISDKKAEVENQIQSLFELKNYKVDKGQNLILAIIASLGAISTVDVVSQWLTNTIRWRDLIISGVFIAVLLLLFCWPRKE